MSVRFIIGRAGTGKTRHCIDAILAEHNAPTHDRPLLLLVPEQASFQMERELALRSLRRGFSRAEVLSFSRLARRIFNQCGRPADEIDAQSRVLALRAAAANSETCLHVFGAAARSDGFFRRLSRLLEELMNEAVSVAQLRAALERIGDPRTRERVSAIATLFEKYLSLLGPDLLDSALRQERLREQLGEAAWLDRCQIWVDGFAGFTGQEMATLAALSTRAQSLEITLLMDPHDFQRAANPAILPELRLFHRTENTYNRMRALLRDQGAHFSDPILLDPTTPHRFQSAPALARLEAFLSGNRVEGDRVVPSPEIRIIPCETHRAELIRAARNIRQSVIESGGALRFRDFALIARDLKPFARLVAEVFAEYSIPFFLDRRRPLAGHPVPRLIAALLSSAARDCPLPSMLRLLRSGLLPLTRDECERIENQALAGEIQGRDAWQRAAWKFAEQQVLDARGLDDGRLRVMCAIEPLFALAHAAHAPGRRWCMAIFEALESLGVSRRLEEWMADAASAGQLEAAETHRLAWEALCGLLDNIVKLLGDQRLSCGEFAEILNGALRDITLGLAPPTVDQVLVSSIERSRHPDIKHAWLFAFNEGVFPARPEDDAILSQSERESMLAVGLPAPASAREDAFSERMLAYIAVTRPSRGLTISYSRIGNDGGERFASPLLRSILQSAPDAQIPNAGSDDIVRTEEELASAIIEQKPARRAQEVLARLEEPAGRERIDWLMRGLRYANRPTPLSEHLRGTNAVHNSPGVIWAGSASQVETFVQCPFKYFSQYGLRIQSERGPLPVEWELGTLAHAVLAAVIRRGVDALPNVREATDGQWDAWLEQEWKAQDDALDTNPACARPQFQSLKSALRPFVREVLLAQAERWRRGEFQPLATEQRFGRDRDEMAGLEVDVLGAGRIRVQGSIDRVDGCKKDGSLYLLIYDYKPNLSSLNRPWLTGAALQTFLYLLAVEQSWAGDGRVVPAGALLSPLFPNATALKSNYVQTSPRDLRRMYLYLPRGVFEAVIAQSLDLGLGAVASPVAMMRLKKDGSLYSSSDAKPAGAVAARLALARETLVQSALGIGAGSVEVSPLVEGQRLACQKCDFRTLCRFEPLLNRARPVERALPVLSQWNGGAP